MIDTDAYKNMTWETPSDELEDAVENLLAEVERLREYKNKLEYALDLCASKEIERWIDEQEARIWGGEEE